MIRSYNMENEGNLSLADGMGDASGAAGGNDGGVSNDPSGEAGAGTGAELGSNSEQTPNSFLAGLDADIKDDPSLKVFIDEKGEFSTTKLAKSYVHAQRKMGEKGVRVPDERSTPEEWNEFYNKVRPSELDKYDVNVKLGENQVLDEATFNAFKEIAHKNGLTANQAAEIAGWFNNTATESQTAGLQQRQEAYNAEVKQLRSDWGEGFEKEFSLAKRALKEFADENTIEYLQKTGLDGDVRLIRLFNKIGHGLMEDSFQKESHGNFGKTKEEAQRRIDDIMEDPAYWDPKSAKNKHLVQEVMKLREMTL